MLIQAHTGCPEDLAVRHENAMFSVKIFIVVPWTGAVFLLVHVLPARLARASVDAGHSRYLG